MWQPACLSLDRLPYLSRGVRWQFALEGVREVGRRVCGAAACWPPNGRGPWSSRVIRSMVTRKGPIKKRSGSHCAGPAEEKQSVFRTPQFLRNPLPALSFWRILNSDLTARRSVSPARVWPSRLTLGPPVDPITSSMSYSTVRGSPRLRETRMATSRRRGRE